MVVVVVVVVLVTMTGYSPRGEHLGSEMRTGVQWVRAGKNGSIGKEFAEVRLPQPGNATDCDG